MREGRLRRPLEKGATLCTASSSLSRGHGPAWPRMGPREALHRSVLLCVSRGPICSRHPRLQELLPQRGWGGWQAGEVCWAAWGTGSPPGAVITPRHLWACRGHTAAPGLPRLARPAPRQEPGGPVATVSGRSSRLLCGCQAFTRATAWVRPPFSSWASRVQVGGRWDPSLARPAASFPGDGPADANTWAKSRETRTGVPHWAHSEGRAVTLAGRTAGHERGSPAAP